MKRLIKATAVLVLLGMTFYFGQSTAQAGLFDREIRIDLPPGQQLEQIVWESSGDQPDIWVLTRPMPEADKGKHVEHRFHRVYASGWNRSDSGGNRYTIVEH